MCFTILSLCFITLWWAFTTGNFYKGWIRRLGEKNWVLGGAVEGSVYPLGSSFSFLWTERDAVVLCDAALSSSFRLSLPLSLHCAHTQSQVQFTLFGKHGHKAKSKKQKARRNRHQTATATHCRHYPLIGLSRTKLLCPTNPVPWGLGTGKQLVKCGHSHPLPLHSRTLTPVLWNMIRSAYWAISNTYIMYFTVRALVFHILFKWIYIVRSLSFLLFIRIG